MVIGAGLGSGGRDGGQRAGGTAVSGASRSPCSATRSSTSPLVNTRSSRRVHCSTSSQVTGVDTVGRLRARSEYGAIVVLWALFWLQSMRTLPGRSDLVIRETT